MVDIDPTAAAPADPDAPAEPAPDRAATSNPADNPAVIGSYCQAMLPTERRAPAPARHPHRLGAHVVDQGVAFAVYASRATAVELCLVSKRDGERSEERYLMYGPENGIWHCTIPGVRPGQLYGYRAYGAWDPDSGLRHNPFKILLDPYARATAGNRDLVPALYAHQVDSELEAITSDLALDPMDSLPKAILGVVTAANFPVAPSPRVPWEQTVIYEAHVRGLTLNLPGVPPELAGTYAGLAHPATIDYLKGLGITTLELLPIHAKLSEPFLLEKGLSNYWGYSTLSYFAPEPSYATRAAQEAGPQAVVDEVRGMVSLLHEAGIEVVLDVVYNHTCEGGHAGPSLSWRGLDNLSYYLHDGGHPARLVDVTGCGNSLNFASTPVVGMALDSLRYWASEVGIDGFRFDLAVTLGRNGAEFSQRHPFMVALATDPVLAGKKMIAEPWDLGPDGWRTGQFPLPFADWNDRYRDAIRSFWLADVSNLAHGRHAHGPHELATRLSGSADIFGHGQLPGGRGPRASINYIASHDGFTLSDLVTYDHKHNEDNAEDNRDGTNNNLSWNHGYEGPVTLDPRQEAAPTADQMELAALVAPPRLRNLRNLWGTLMVSAGTPMFVAGDEFGRTQQGNNNAYCQDSPISWVNWDWKPWQWALFKTSTYLLRLRREHPVMRPSTFASGRVHKDDCLADLSWYDRAGNPLTPGGWHDPANRVMQMLRSGAPWGDVDLLVVFNGTLEQVTIDPPKARGRVFRLMWDSGWPDPDHRMEDDSDDLGVPGFSTTGQGLSAEVAAGLNAGTGVAATLPSMLTEMARATYQNDGPGDLTEMPVAMHGMSSQMDPLSMRIYFAEVPADLSSTPQAHFPRR